MAHIGSQQLLDHLLHALLHQPLHVGFQQWLLDCHLGKTQSITGDLRAAVLTVRVCYDSRGVPALLSIVSCYLGIAGLPASTSFRLNLTSTSNWNIARSSSAIWLGPSSPILT